jgi:hypothetical protein
MNDGRTMLVGALLSIGLMSGVGEARVVRIAVEQNRPFAGGKSFGAAGPYVRLEGTAHFEVDPKDPLNALIVNLDRAPRNAKGLVEFRTRFVIIKPVDFSRGNQKILYGINNRGNPIELRFHQLSAEENEPEGGDGLIFRLGYTFVDAGWAGDIVSTGDRLGAELPIAVQPDGSPIVAPIRVEYEEADLKGYTVPVKGNTRFRSYETADTDTSRSVLTVRDSINGSKRVVPPDRWAFGRCPTGQASLEPTTTDLCLFDGFQPNRIYDLTYPAKNPWVMGLGYAVTRDLASFLRYAARDDAGTPNPVGRDATSTGIRRAYATGTSSTGMYLRDFLYLGFNEDEAHRKVFDAVRILIPGTHRLFANVEFADPDVYSRQDEHPDFLSYSHPPLTYGVTTDPISGMRDGILKRPATDPLVLHIDTANEFWQMNASLNVHDGHGKSVPLPDNVRLYSLSSHSHGGSSGVAAMPTARGVCQYPTNNSNSYNSIARAMLVALDEWADRGVAPPGSRFADVRDGTLVSLEEAARSFPKIPGVKFPTVMNGLRILDFGPRFGPTGGWLTKLPPEKGAQYRVLVPKPDQDGLDLGGVRTLDIAVPVGTNTGWNLIAAAPRSTDLCGLSGSFVPFAKTKAERVANGDPRISLEERYKDHTGFAKAVETGARRLVKERFLLEEDAQKLVGIARASAILK